MLWWTLRQLESKDSATRRRAAEKLGESHDTRSLLALAATLKDREISVRQAAIESLARIASPPAITALLAGLESDSVPTRLAIIQALKASFASYSHSPIEPHVVRALADVLKNYDAGVATSAIELLAQIDAAAASRALLVALANQSSRVRERAANALGKLGAASAIEPLAAALKDPQTEVRSAAAEALGGIGEAEALAGLVAALCDLDHNVRWRVAEIVNGHVDQWKNSPVAAAVVPDFIALLRNENWYVRECAVRSIGAIGDPRGFDALALALKDDNEYVRQAAAIALDALGPPPADEAQKARIALAHRDWDALITLSASAVEPLLAALRDETWEARAEALSALGKIGDPRAFDALITGARDPYGSVRAAAAEALGNLGDKRAVATLVELLADKHERAREASAASLKRLADPQAVPALIKVLNDNNQKVASLSASALTRIGGPAVARLIELLDDRCAPLRLIASRLLGEIADQRAIERLAAALKDEDEAVRVAAEASLNQIAPDWEKTEAAKRAVPALIATLNSPQLEIRKNAVRMLEKIAEQKAQLPLVVLLKDEDRTVRAMTSRALSSLGWQPQSAAESAWNALAQFNRDELQRIGSAAYEPFIEALDHKDPALRALAASQLGALKDARAVDPLIEVFNRSYGAVRLAIIVALGELGDSRAVQPILAKIADLDTASTSAAAAVFMKMGDGRAVRVLLDSIGGRFFTSSKVRALEQLLEVMAMITPVEDLREAAGLDRVIQLDTAYADCGYSYTVETPVDCALVRQLARQELIRRGLEA